MACATNDATKAKNDGQFVINLFENRHYGMKIRELDMV